MSKNLNFDSLSDSSEASERLESHIIHGKEKLIKLENIVIDVDDKTSRSRNIALKNNDRPSSEGHTDQKSSLGDKDYNHINNIRGDKDLHFMNSCRRQKSVFTCAIDSFLEIAYSTFGPYIAEVETQSLFFDLITKCLKSYSIILNSDNGDDRDNEQNLSVIRQPVWDFLVSNCASFKNRDCNAEFSQIFAGQVVHNLTMQEKGLFETR